VLAASWGALEWTFVFVVGSFVLAAGLFGLYLLLLPFRNTGLRRRSPRPAR
jgi:ABC-type sugar transport system permease subunit